MVRCGDPDAIDSIVPMAYGNLALDLILNRIHGRLVVLKNGRYDNMPIDTVTATKKVVNVKEHYNIERLRPVYQSFEMKPLFLMTSDLNLSLTGRLLRARSSCLHSLLRTPLAFSARRMDFSRSEWTHNRSSLPPAASPSPSTQHRALIVDSSPETESAADESLRPAEGWTSNLPPVTRKPCPLPRSSIRSDRHGRAHNRQRKTLNSSVVCAWSVRTPASSFSPMNSFPGTCFASIRERAFSYFARPFSTEKLAEMIHSGHGRTILGRRHRDHLRNSRLGALVSALRPAHRQPADSVLPRSLRSPRRRKGRSG